MNVDSGGNASGPDNAPATNVVPDADLVGAARRGDKRAFIEIVARHQAMVCGVAFGILGDFAASEDAGQDAFLMAWQKIHTLREPDRLRAWLGQIARNAALGRLRRRREHETLEESMVLPDDAPAPDEAVANEEEAALVRASLAALPELYRLPLILYYRENQSVHAVAQTLGISDDAVKQRLARGREMLRDRISGLIETVLVRTRPTGIFTMTIAAAVGALAAPAIVAGSAFGSASVATGAASTASGVSTPILTVMSTAKTLVVTTALAAFVCIPVGYHISPGKSSLAETNAAGRLEGPAAEAFARTAAPSFEESALFLEWRQLHERFGTNATAMPVLYQAIANLSDPFRRQAFSAALIAEWAQIDPRSGLAFFLGKGPDAAQRRQFLDEWLARDAKGAVDALLSGNAGWESVARDRLPEIARRVPSRMAEIVSRLPKSGNYSDTKVRDAFAILADAGVEPARKAAETMTGPNREQAMAGVAQTWAKSDLAGAVAWAKSQSSGGDRDDVIRAALVGKAAVDPITALDQLGLVPSGGRQASFATTTGARVLAEAAKTDFGATVAWMVANPGRLDHEDLDGLSTIVTERLNGESIGFLATQAESGVLSVLVPAIGSALLNNAAGQRSKVWDWLRAQPDNDAVKLLKEQVLNSAGYQDPTLALSLVGDLPATPAGDSQLQSLASSLLNGGRMLHRFGSLWEQAPERLRQPLAEAAFNFLRGDSLDDSQLWIQRLTLLPESARPKGTESIARAWAEKSPEEAIDWAISLAAGNTRSGALAAITSAWAAKDAHGAGSWIASLAPGSDRDRSAGSFVFAVAERFPREAWDWALSISDTAERSRAAAHATKMMAAKDPAAARQWIETGPFTLETKVELNSALEKLSPRAPTP